MIKKFNIYFYLAPVAAGLIFYAAMPLAYAKPFRPKPPAPVVITADPSMFMGRALPEQERLVYRIKWMGLTAGELVCEIKGKVVWKGRLCYLIEITARSLGLVSGLYRVNDLYRSYLDVETMHTLRHEEHRHEGHYHKDAVTDFDHEAGRAYFKNAADGSEKVFDIPYGVQDNLTAAYIARLLPLAPGKMLNFKMCNSEKVYDFYLEVQRRLKYRSRDVLHIVPFARINGERFKEGRASGYVSDDEKRVPLLAIIKAPVFTKVTAILLP
jgi:hypothetical protein